MLRVGVLTLLRSVTEQREIARACEEVGIWGLGLGDTAPHLYQDTYVTATSCLIATKHLRVGPTVTNTVSRHWSVLAATARTCEELAPGRFFAGIGTGDGAVHSVGLQPASWVRLENDLCAVRDLAPSMELHIAASGPRGAVSAGRFATDLMLGTGLDAQAILDLARRARLARQHEEITQPIRVWTVANLFIAPSQRAADELKSELRPRVTGFARFSFATTFEGKAVPTRWQTVLRERLADYDFRSHGTTGATANAGLFEDIPELEAYLLNRFMLIGRPQDCADRVLELSEASGLDGIWLAIGPSSINSDLPALVRSLAPLVEQLSNA